MADNTTLRKAKQQKKDEFYTQLVDIENELKHYKAHFEGKVVYCNCDDPYESNFFKYFAMRFDHPGVEETDRHKLLRVTRRREPTELR